MKLKQLKNWNVPSDGGVGFWTLLPDTSDPECSLSFRSFCCRFLCTKQEIKTIFNNNRIVPQTETLTITINGISPWSSKERIIDSRESNEGWPFFKIDFTGCWCFEIVTKERNEKYEKEKKEKKIRII